MMYCQVDNNFARPGVHVNQNLNVIIANTKDALWLCQTVTIMLHL